MQFFGFRDVSERREATTHPWSGGNRFLSNHLSPRTRAENARHRDSGLDLIKVNYRILTTSTLLVSNICSWYFWSGNHT